MSLKIYIKRVLRYILKGVPNNHITVVTKQVSPGNLLKNKRIIITGGGRGLGYYMAQTCIAEGAEVLITGRNEERLKESSEQLGSNCKYLVFDVQNVSKMSDFFKEASRIFDNKKIDCLVSNAGISLHEGNFRNVTEDGWDKQLNTNLKGNYFMVSNFIKYLEQQKDTSGNIVVISSERAKRADDIPYGLTKIATNSFVQAIASKVITEGIRINVVAPGVTTSDMTGFNRNENMYVDWQNNHRVFLPEEVAKVVLFLLSDVSSCISGEIITCDQGNYIVHW